MFESHLETPVVKRHRAAIVRHDLSRPVRLALESGLFEPGFFFFDYGCGKGEDISLVSDLGYVSNGYDPYYRPDSVKIPSEVVNLGFVLNIIENPEERNRALLSAWELARRVLIVAVQEVFADHGKSNVAFGDGVLTSRNTFQKYFRPGELKTYVDETLNVDSLPVGPGIVFVFRDREQAEKFRLRRVHRQRRLPEIKATVRKYQDYKELLAPLMSFVEERGRLPEPEEIINQDEIERRFGSISKAFACVREATGNDFWDATSKKRREDLLVYIALSKFGNRPTFNMLPSELRADVRVFFGTYTKACEEADLLLFSLGRLNVIAGRCRASRIGKLLNSALYVHVSALSALDPILRLYEGCASRTFGEIEGTTLIKFHFDKPKVSYLCYPEFDADPHPVLKRSVQADFLTLEISWRDYSASPNPPILHRKETFVDSEYPHRQKFERLTKQEEKRGLLSESHLIGMKNAWEHRLKEHSVELRGHRLINIKSTSVNTD